MHPVFDVELERQLLAPGEPLSGRLTLPVEAASQAKRISAILHGDELVGQERLGGLKLAVVEVVEDLVAPVASHVVQYHFTLTLPPDAPPSFSSGDLQCRYSLILRLTPERGWKQSQSYSVTVIPAFNDIPEAESVTASVDQEDVALSVDLDANVVAAGSAVTGGFEILQRGPEAPSHVRLRLTSIEQRTDAGAPRRITAEAEQLVPLGTHDAHQVAGAFSLPVPPTAPFSYAWHLFRVAWELEVQVQFPKAPALTLTLPITVHRMERLYATGIP